YSGGGNNSPQTFAGSVTIGKPISISTTLDTTAPPAGTGYTPTTGPQTGRLFCDGVASPCGSVKANPGLNTAVGARQYDAYTFTNTAGSASCITVKLTSSVELFSAAYTSAGFTPATPNLNYLADAGGSNTVVSYSFDVAADQSFTVV